MSTPSTESIIASHDAFMTHNYARFPLAIARGQGCELWTAEGKRILDLFAGFGAPSLGHCHPDLVKAATEQAGTLWHVGNLLHTEPQTRLAEKLHQHSGGMHSFFCHAGADANEAAIKMARLYGLKNPGPEGQRYGVISATRSFHGRSLATIQATGNPAVREGFGPPLPGFQNVAWGSLDAIEDALTASTVAILLEPIQGEGGVHMPPEGYLESVRELCDRRDLLLICDEVWTGGGRTGKAFAHQHWDCKPDIVTLAKGVGGGLPLGVMMCTEKHAPLFDWQTWGRAVHATTLGGSPLVTAVAARIWEVIERDNLIARADTLGQTLQSELEAIGNRTGTVADVRGLGLFKGVQLNPDALPEGLQNAGDVVKACLDKGLLINATQGDTLRIAPALTISDEALREGLHMLESVLAG